MAATTITPVPRAIFPCVVCHDGPVFDGETCLTFLLTRVEVHRVVASLARLHASLATSTFGC